MKKWSLMSGIAIGALVVALAAFAAQPLSALAQAGASAISPAAVATTAPGTAPDGRTRLTRVQYIITVKHPPPPDFQCRRRPP